MCAETQTSFLSILAAWSAGTQGLGAAMTALAGARAMQSASPTCRPRRMEALSGDSRQSSSIHRGRQKRIALLIEKKTQPQILQLRSSARRTAFVQDDNRR